MARFPLVKQQDQSDCGVAALASILLYYKRPTGLQLLRERAGTDIIGTNFVGLMEAAEHVGLSATGVKGSYDALRSAKLPAIAHVKNKQGLGHFVVLYRVSAKQVVVGDPATGIVKLSREEFCEQWTGYLLLVEPQPVSEVGGSKARIDTRQPPSAVSRLFRLLSVHRGILCEILLCALAMTLLGLGTSVFIQHLVDSVLVQGHTGLLNALGIGMLLAVLFRSTFGALRGYFLAHLGRKVDFTLMSVYMRHVVRLPIRFFETRRVGEIISRSSDAAKIREAISGSATTIVLDGLMLMIASVVLWAYDPQLAVVATAFAPLLLLVLLAHQPAAKRRSRRAMEEAASYSAHAIEDIHGMATIKALGLERMRSARRDTSLLNVIQAVFSLSSLGISMTAASSLAIGVAGITVLWYGGHRVIAGELTIGQLMFFFTMLGHVLGPLERFATVNLQIQDALVAVDRLFEILDLQTETASDAKQERLSQIAQEIRFEAVRFRYGCREEVLRGVDLSVPAGATVGIVGESGSGKSTLLKLLMRFYDPDGGRLVFDGMDSRDLRIESVRDAVALVSQDTFVFNGTIRDNIAVGDTSATMHQVVAASAAAGLEQFINGLPDRYETVIGEHGTNLSGGQRQRLAIARALLRDAPLLLLDEATSQLDTTTERRIQQNLRSQLRGKTVVMVAHRLSTVRDADLIYVMHAGQVVESGTHDQLLVRDGRYAALWRTQTGTDDMPISAAIPTICEPADKFGCIETEAFPCSTRN